MPRDRGEPHDHVDRAAGAIETDSADALHERGVRVFCDFNPWDTGTRRGRADAEELAALIADFGFDGVFLDTLKQADAALIDPLFAANPGLALETESKLALDDLGTHTMSWAQWYADSPVPGVLKTHFYEPRHLQHHIRSAASGISVLP